MMMQFIMPEDYDYAVSTVNRAAVVLDGQLISVSPTGTVEVLEDDLDEETGYMAPVKLRYTFEGKTLDGSDPVHVSLTTTPATSQSFEKLDLLAELPWLVRKALQLLISKPFVFQYLHDQYEVEVQVGSGEKKTLKGRTFEETVHLS